MKIAVLTDIHSNYIALQRCVDYALSQGVDTFAFLGDYLGECGHPHKTMDMIYTLKNRYNCYFVKGNKEDSWLWFTKDGKEMLEYGSSVTGTLLYQVEKYRSSEQQFFEGLPIVHILQWEGLPSILLCHGTPASTTQGMKQEEPEYLKIIEKYDVDIILCGHTHRRREMHYGNKIVYNPGSVGAPLESGGKTQFMILQSEDGAWSTEYVDLEYDVNKLLSELRSERLDKYAPYWFQITEILLQTGEISHCQILGKVMEKCREDMGECIWPHIPEKYWEAELKEIQKYIKTS